MDAVARPVPVGFVVLVVVVVGLFVFLTRNPDPDDSTTRPTTWTPSPGRSCGPRSSTRGSRRAPRRGGCCTPQPTRTASPSPSADWSSHPRTPGPGLHPVLAWAHGTTGVARPCAPSLSDAPFESHPDMTGALAEGWVLALTDYPGLGTRYRTRTSSARARAGPSSTRSGPPRARHRRGARGRVRGVGPLAGWPRRAFRRPARRGVPARAGAPRRRRVAPATRLEENFAAIEGSQAGNVLTILAIDSSSTTTPRSPTTSSSSPPGALRLASPTPA